MIPKPPDRTQNTQEEKRKPQTQPNAHDRSTRASLQLGERYPNSIQGSKENYDFMEWFGLGLMQKGTDISSSYLVIPSSNLSSRAKRGICSSQESSRIRVETLPEATDYL